MAAIESRHLTIGADRLCVECRGAGAIIHATAELPRRPATRGELAEYARGKGPAVRCLHCQGVGIEPGSRVLRQGDSPAEDDAARWPA